MTMVTVPVYKKRRRTVQKAAASDQAHLIQDGFFAQTSWIDFNSSTSTHWYMITLDEIGNESTPCTLAYLDFAMLLWTRHSPHPV